MQKISVKTIVSIASFAILILMAPFQEVSAAGTRMLVRMDADRAQAQTIADMGFDIAAAGEGRVEVIATKGELERLAGRVSGYEVIAEDANSAFPAIRELPSHFRRYEQLVKELKDTAAAHSDICRLVSIGKSFEGRDIYAVNIGGGAASGSKKPAVLFMGLHHAREWMSAEAALAIVNGLTSGHGTDGEIKRLVDARDIWIVPVVNPDGLVFSQTSDASWRKNRRRNPDGSYGVDLNRNYGYQWGLAGASDDMFSNVYRGPKPYSEASSAAIRKLAEEKRFVASVSFHGYFGQVLYPYSYSVNAVAKDEALLVRMAVDIAKIYGYVALKSSKLYEAMGSSDDYLYAVMGALPFSIELGQYGFAPAAPEAAKICAASVSTALYILERAGDTHASNHPDHATPLAVAMSRYVYAVSTGCDGRVAAEGLASLLAPDADPSGKRLDEFLGEVMSCDGVTCATYAPVVERVREMYMGRVHSAGSARYSLCDIDRLGDALRRSAAE